ncbi:MAG: recombinase family protein [Clostridiaceae bacterium]
MNIAIYTRKSIYKEHSESIETQINMIKSYFQRNDNSCTFEIFEDEGFSGKNTNRPAFTRMMKLAKTNKFDIVAVYKLDRIARNIVDFVNIYDELEKLNIKLISITEGFDPSTPIGKMMMLLLASFADMERMNIAQRVKDNMFSLAKKGCFTGGFIPLGCSTIKKEDGKSYLVISQVDKIKAIFNEYLNVQSLYSTHKNLTQQGIETTVTRESLATILRNPIYVKSNKEVLDYLSKKFEVVGKANGKGLMTYGKTSGYPTVIVGKHDGVIDPNDWLKVQQILDKKKDDSYNKESKTYWLTQVLKCPLCGSDYILVNSGRNTYYACGNRILRNGSGKNFQGEKCINNKYVNAIQIESKVEKFIVLLALEGFENFIRYYKKPETPPKDLIKEIESKLLKNEKAIESLVDKLILVSTAAATPITKKIEELTSLNENLKIDLEVEKLKKLEKELNSNTDEIIFNTILDFSKIKTNEEKRLQLRKIFSKLVYDPISDSLEPDFL